MTKVIFKLMEEAAEKVLAMNFKDDSKGSINYVVCETLCEELTKLVETDYTFSKSHRNSDQVKDKVIVAKHIRTGIEIYLTFSLSLVITKKSSYDQKYNLKHITLELNKESMYTLDNVVRMKQEENLNEYKAKASELEESKEKVLGILNSMITLVNANELIEKCSPYIYDTLNTLQYAVRDYNESAAAAKALIDID